MTVSPVKFSQALFAEMAPDAILCADTGANLTWVMQSAAVKKGQRIISAWGNSPMGYALPAAIGAKLACPERQVVATIGDGGMQMTIRELQTIVGNNIDVKIFVFNNRSLGNIAIGSEAEFGRQHGINENTGYTAPDFVAVAQAYGVWACRMVNEDRMGDMVRTLLGLPHAALCELDVDPAETHTEARV